MNEIKKRVITKPMSRQPNQRRGEWGEKKALYYLQGLGYQIVAQNLRFKNYEVDLIAVDRNSLDLVFVEVKSSFTNYFGSPSLRVGYKKLQSMTNFARVYLKNYRDCQSFRFDVIAVTPFNIDHYQNVSW